MQASNYRAHYTTGTLNRLIDSTNLTEIDRISH